MGNTSTHHYSLWPMIPRLVDQRFQRCLPESCYIHVRLYTQDDKDKHKLQTIRKVLNDYSKRKMYSNGASGLNKSVEETAFYSNAHEVIDLYDILKWITCKR